MNQHDSDLEALHDVALASSGVLDPDALGRLAMERARNILGGDVATLLWFDPAANGLRVLGDTYVTPFPRVVGVGEGSAGIAFQKGEPVLVEDYPGWEHAVKDALSRGLKSVLAVPLIVRSQPVGALTISFNTPHKFTDADVRTATLLATQVAPALEAARLHVTLEKTNEALREASLHKSQFLANMSHELRTPLNSIIGFSELLTEREDQFDESTRKRFMTQILTSGRHLLGLINDILDLSKVEAGQMELKLERTSVVEIADLVARTAEPLLVNKAITLQIDVPADVELVADPAKLKQMLLNLVSNAIKFTPDGGTVTIGATQAEDKVAITVADTGIGISEADQKQLFVEFHQVDQGTGRRHEGTGLGLALTRRFALLHGGDVRVASAPGKGSVFTIALPVRRPTPAHKEAPPHAPLVLVVEDEPAAAELLTRLLNNAGYRTHVVGKGQDVHAAAHELKPAAITLDIIMPGLDGWDIISQLKGDPATSTIPIVVVSVVDNQELGRALGAIDYFVKPIDAKALIGRLRSLELKPSEELRVLVVDDEAANREWLTHTLEPEGFSVMTASGGREAIEMTKSEKPDVVLLDLLMPEVTGFDVVEELRAEITTRETPILVLTAATLSETDRAMLSGRVSTILQRGTVGTADLVSQLRRVAPSA